MSKRCTQLDDEISELNNKHRRIEARLKLVREESEQEKTVLEEEIKTMKSETEQLKQENEALVVKSQQVKKVAFVDSSASPTPPSSPAAEPPVVQSGNINNAEVGKYRDSVLNNNNLTICLYIRWKLGSKKKLRR